KRIRHLGFVPRKDLPALLGGALFMVRPSLYDGFSLPVLEAMACGCPVISSSTTAAREITGDAGLLVDPRDIEKIAFAMRRLMSDEGLRAILEKKGLRRAAEFSAAKMARETLRLYREVCGR
ncbi:MAG: glycosyltransferase, partial [Candidatus Margulisiibacteriota bacterium]